MKLTIGYFYSSLLNLYGDNGNVEILAYRAKRRNVSVEVLHVGVNTDLSTDLLKKLNIIFIGGGPDAGQKAMYQDLLANKGSFLKDYIESGGVGLYVCGSYQLLGQYYKAADESMLPGLGVFDLYTQHFGKHKPRCIGNVVAKLNTKITSDPVFSNVKGALGDSIVGFENHGGRTYLGKNLAAFADVVLGHGNNSEDKSEGLFYKNSIGTYFHGPILSKNPHLADFLIAKSLGLEALAPLDDTYIVSAHAACKNLRQ